MESVESSDSNYHASAFPAFRPSSFPPTHHTCSVMYVYGGPVPYFVVASSPFCVFSVTHSLRGESTAPCDLTPVAAVHNRKAQTEAVIS